ncbi:hypothetical protein MSP8886_03688 [Marinomonas spartinae]|uniref:DUF2955 domain-containing protein n=2 Tax=Marinomonas spartinae TaxID=1792290 RepID=A0A1A8TS91_9GAMM|nr:hypothetical protein MSP8886_03688 [Marinomonas spartinae]
MYELIRKTLIIVLCLMLSKMLHLNVSVYVVLFAIVVATTSFSKHLTHLLQRLMPSVAAAVGAVFVNQLFADHPFIIWTCCIVYFDHVRRHADNNLRIRMATLPLFMIIFITTYSNSSGYILAIPNIIRDVVLSAFLAALVASLVNHLMPVKAQPPKPVVVPQPVYGTDRLKMLILVGGGLAFIMINEVTSAVFCLVPLITSAMQPTHAHMKQHAIEKILAQVGGCSLAVIASLIYSGTEVDVYTYFVVSFLLVYLILYWSHYSEAGDRAIHADALMGFLIPYQLYVAKNGNDFGLHSIALRAVELIIALLIIYALAHWLNRLGQRNNVGPQPE